MQRTETWPNQWRIGSQKLTYHLPGGKTIRRIFQFDFWCSRFFCWCHVFFFLKEGIWLQTFGGSIWLFLGWKTVGVGVAMIFIEWRELEPQKGRFSFIFSMVNEDFARHFEFSRTLHTHRFQIYPTPQRIGWFQFRVLYRFFWFFSPCNWVKNLLSFPGPAQVVYNNLGMKGPGAKDLRENLATYVTEKDVVSMRVGLGMNFQKTLLPLIKKKGQKNARMEVGKIIYIYATYVCNLNLYIHIYIYRNSAHGMYVCIYTNIHAYLCVYYV